jgi:hypothetical protein
MASPFDWEGKLAWGAARRVPDRGRDAEREELHKIFREPPVDTIDRDVQHFFEAPTLLKLRVRH